MREVIRHQASLGVDQIKLSMSGEEVRHSDPPYQTQKPYQTFRSWRPGPLKKAFLMMLRRQLALMRRIVLDYGFALMLELVTRLLNVSSTVWTLYTMAVTSMRLPWMSWRRTSTVILLRRVSTGSMPPLMKLVLLVTPSTRPSKMVIKRNWTLLSRLARKCIREESLSYRKISLPFVVVSQSSD